MSKFKNFLNAIKSKVKVTTILKVALFIITIIMLLIMWKEHTQTKIALQEKKMELLQMSVVLKERDSIIDTLQDDLDKYKTDSKDSHDRLDKIVSKYKDIQVKNDTCEAQLSAAKEYLREWYYHD